MVKAATTSPDDGLILNNCAAILNMSGIEQKAIPILKYILQSYPDNAMLLNNLGRLMLVWEKQIQQWFILAVV